MLTSAPLFAPFKKKDNLLIITVIYEPTKYSNPGLFLLIAAPLQKEILIF